MTGPSRDSQGAAAAPVAARPAPARRVVAGFFAVVVAFEALHGRHVEWARWRVSEQNPAVAEAHAWWQGRLTLTGRPYDSAADPRTGAVYNVFPPLQTMICAVLLAPLPGRGSPPEVPPLVAAAVFGWSVMLAGYVALYRLTGSAAWAVVWTMAWLAGAANVPAFHWARDSSVYFVNHLLAQLGLWLIVADLLGRQRVWPSLLGLAVATWSRQLTLFYALPILLVAWRRADGQRARTLAAAGLVIGVLVAVPLLLNAARFGDPLESGYRFLYTDRDDRIAYDARTHGLFSPHFIPRNAWFMNLEVPTVEWRDGRLAVFPSRDGASMWLSTPLLALAWLTARRWWRDAVRRALMLGTLPVVALLLCYHSTGYNQPGYYRFALDFVPIWFGVAATSATGRRWRFATLACAAWGVVYFAVAYAYCVGV